MKAWLVRLPMLLALAGLLTWLVLGSSLASLVSLLPSPPSPLGAWVLAALVLAFVPALVARASPLPATLAVVVPALVLASYGAGRIDWLRVLKDFGVQEKGAIDLLRLLMGALAVLLAWAIHVADMAVRLKERSAARGVPEDQTGSATRIVLRDGAVGAGLALACAAGVALLAFAGVAIGDLGAASKAAFVAPVLAAVLLAGAGVWLARSA